MNQAQNSEPLSERKAIIEVEAVTERMGEATLSYLLDLKGDPLSEPLRIEIERRMRFLHPNTTKC